MTPISERPPIEGYAYKNGIQVECYGCSKGGRVLFSTLPYGSEIGPKVTQDDREHAYQAAQAHNKSHDIRVFTYKHTDYKP